MSSKEKVIVYLILIVIGFILLAAVYFASRWSPLAGALVLGVSVYIWLSIAPRSYHSDPAGDGMSAGFEAIFSLAKAIVLTIVFYLFMRNNEPDTVLRVTMFLLFLYFAKQLIWKRG